MWEYRARLSEYHDGDTIRIMADVGFDGREEPWLRLKDVWAPELHEPGGPETASFIKGWLISVDLKRRWPLRIVTSVTTTLVEPKERKSFDRFVVDVYNIDTGAWLNQGIREFLVAHPEYGPGVQVVREFLKAHPEYGLSLA